MVSLLGVLIDLMHLMKPGGFDVSSFFRDIISPPTCESELGLQLQPCDKLEDLKRRVRAKEQKKRAMNRWGKTHKDTLANLDGENTYFCSPSFHFSHIFRVNLCLGEGVNVAVGIYPVAVPTKVQGSIRLYRETNKPVHSKTRTFHTQTGSLLLPSEMKKAQVRADWHSMTQHCCQQNCSTGPHGSSSIKQKNVCVVCVHSGVWEEADSDGERRGECHQEV